MKTIDELKAEHAKELAKLELELKVAQAATVTPNSVMLTDRLGHWLMYSVRSLADACEIMKASSIVPFNRYAGTFTHLKPEVLIREKDGEHVEGPFACSIKVEQGRGFGPIAELRFFTMAKEYLCHAHIKIDRNGNYGWGARYEEIMGPNNRVLERRWVANEELTAMSDSKIKWGYGGDKAASFEYLWAADTVEGGCAHALGMLANVKEGS